MSSAKERLQKAFDKAVEAVSNDIPLMMHSVGDSLTPDPDTVRLVSALTVQYMGRLVDAALDAREIFHPDIHEGTIPPLPPPPLDNHRAAPKRKREQFWDDPLPKPKIRSRETPKPTTEDVKDNEAQEWVGLAGVDLWEQSRARAAYVRGITSHQFIFPLCHDSYLYGRIRGVQAKKMAEFGPLLQDTVVQDTVQTEGQLLYRQTQQQRRLRRTNANPNKKSKKEEKAKKDESEINSDPEDDDEDSDTGDKSDDEGDGPRFPGMEAFLPVYRTFPPPS